MISILVFIVLCAAVCLNTGCGAGISVQGGAAKAYIKEKYGISARVRNVDVKKAWCLERGSTGGSGLVSLLPSCPSSCFRGVARRRE